MKLEKIVIEKSSQYNYKTKKDENSFVIKIGYNWYITIENEFKEDYFPNDYECRQSFNFEKNEILRFKTEQDAKNYWNNFINNVPENAVAVLGYTITQNLKN